MTPRVLQHKRRRIALKRHRTQKNKEEASEYAKLLAKRMKVKFKFAASSNTATKIWEPRSKTVKVVV